MSKNFISKLKGYHWLAIFFVGITHLIGLIAWPVYVYFDGMPQWQEITAFIFMYLLAIIGINLGYHRGMSHLSFKMSPLMKFIALFSASSAVENSALHWCSDHRRHHRYQDSDGDPYNIKKGFWWAHMGWMFKTPPKEDFSNCPDLTKDPLIVNQHKYYFLWVVVSAFALPLAIGFLLGRPWATLLLAGFTRLMLVNQFTYLVNSWAHYFGRRPYDAKSTARDSLLVAFLASGEGYHNFHHRFPFDFRNGHRWYHWDPVKWLIYIARSVGLVFNLKQTPVSEIYRARIQAQQSRLQTQSPQLAELSESLERLLNQWRQHNYEWQKLRASFDRSRKEKIRQVRARLKQTQEEFKLCYQEWQAAYLAQVAA